MTQFQVEHGGQSYSLATGETTIGSSADCTIHLEGANVEPVHAAIQTTDAAALLQSRVVGEFDVRVNGRALHAAEIAPGSTVQFGELELTLESSPDGLRLTGPSGTFPLQPGLTNIGRSPEATIRLDHASVSREHAAIMLLPSGQVRLRDLGSSNGTEVDGQRMGEQELKDGDQIQIAGEVLAVSASAPAPTPQVGGQPAAAAGPSGPQFKLQYGGETRTLEPGELRIGRAPDCEIIFADDSLISRYHASLTVTPTEVVVKDLGSANGTYVNSGRLVSEQLLNDGDRIGLGKQEIRFIAEMPAGGLAKTVLAENLGAGVAKTVLVPKGQQVASQSPPSSAAPAGAADATGRAALLQVLDLRPDASDDLIQKRYNEMYSDFQIRLSNAPTAELRSTYTNRLEEIRRAYQALFPDRAAAGGASDLPSQEPVAVSPHHAEKEAAPAEPSVAAEKPQKAKKARKEKAAKTAAAPTSGEKLPRSTITMIVLAGVAIVASVVWAILAFHALGVKGQAVKDLADMQQSMTQMDADIPKTEAELAELQKGKAALLENSDLKICNLSSRPIYITWLNATWVAPDGKFHSFSSDRDADWHEWTIEPGGTFKETWVSGDKVIWDGTAMFASILFEYDGREYFRSGAITQLGTDCYSLDLDQ